MPGPFPARAVHAIRRNIALLSILALVPLLAACDRDYVEPKAPRAELAQVTARSEMVGDTRAAWYGLTEVIAVDGVSNVTVTGSGKPAINVTPGRHRVRVRLLSAEEESGCDPISFILALNNGICSTTAYYGILADFDVAMVAGHTYEALFQLDSTGHVSRVFWNIYNVDWINAPVTVQMFDVTAGKPVSRPLTLRFKHFGYVCYSLLTTDACQ